MRIAMRLRPPVPRPVERRRALVRWADVMRYRRPLVKPLPAASDAMRAAAAPRRAGPRGRTRRRGNGRERVSGTLVHPEAGVAVTGGPSRRPSDLLGRDLRGKWRVILGV